MRLDIQQNHVFTFAFMCDGFAKSFTKNPMKSLREAKGLPPVSFSVILLLITNNLYRDKTYYSYFKIFNLMEIFLLKKIVYMPLMSPGIFKNRFNGNAT